MSKGREVTDKGQTCPHTHIDTDTDWGAEAKHQEETQRTDELVKATKIIIMQQSFKDATQTSPLPFSPV